MNLCKLSLLLVLFLAIGCNQSDSNTDTEGNEQPNSQSSETESGSSGGTDNAEAEPERIGKILARVDGTPIYEDDLNGRNLEFVVAEEIIYRAGVKQGIDKEYKDKVKQYEKVLVIDGTKAKILENMGPTKEISDEEIERHYKANKNRYSYARIHEITFPEVNMGNEIKERAAKGEELKDIASSYPDVVVLVTDLGFNRQLAALEFEDKEVGALSDVTQKEDGTFRVLKIVEVKDIPLNTSKKSIRNILESKRKGEMFENYADELAKENNITVEIIE